jgi:NADH-quinone oxidoreductase subunit L
MPNPTNIALIVLLPLAGFLLNGLFGRKYFKGGAGILGTVIIGMTTVLAFETAYGYFFDYGKLDGVYRSVTVLQFTWLEFSPGLSINMGLLLDPLSVMMLVVISLVSLMVHIYSLGYMKGEERFAAYYAHLSLFTFSMLGLVLSTNIFQLYMFWEGVGVSSYLLIGFYYNRSPAVAASKKAFIITRFADLGFLIGILVLSYYAGTLDFNTLVQRLTTPGSTELKTAVSASFLGISALTWGALLVFMGGAGKSAMFPFHIWLPDAMEGPTPVSALIHAATMVVAGVCLVARIFPLLAISTPVTLEVVAWTGAVSAAIAAIIACTQTDIKRVLAYSTMSQIGYMMLALGVARYGRDAGLGYTASLFHLFTHAMFKALLFLCAGTVIHYVHSNEMKDMGGLRKWMPITHITFLVACFAIAGIPPFSGFFSKEEILLAAYRHNRIMYMIALLTSGLTAFYMFRLYFGIFWNKPFHPHGVHHGEGGVTMMLPLVVLGIGAAFAGFIPFGRFITTDGQPLETVFHLSFSVAPVAVGLLGIFVAMKLYLRGNDSPQRGAVALGVVYRTAYHKFYIDEIYLFITKKIIFRYIGAPAAWFDRNMVNGAMNLSAGGTQAIAEKIKKFQSGRVQGYAAWFLAGVIGLVILFVYVWMK